MKKYLFVINNFNIGGPQKSLLSLLHELPENIDITVEVLNGDLSLAKYLPEHVKIRRSDQPIPLLMLDRKYFIKNFFKNLIKTPKIAVDAIGLILKNIKPSKPFIQYKQSFWRKHSSEVDYFTEEYYDVAIGVSGGHSVYYVADFVNAKNKIGWVRTEYQNLNRNIELDSIYFSQVDKILSVSNKCTQKFTEYFPSCELKTETFYNTMPFKMYQNLQSKKQFKFEKSVVNIVTISRLDYGKGFNFLLESAYSLMKSGYKFRWHIFGTGKLHDKIKSKIKEYELDNYIYLQGFVFNTGDILRNADILVHPSEFEGKSNTIDEAKYYKVPIVATNFPTVNEQLTHLHDSLITEMNPKSLSDAIVKLLESEELQKKFKSNLDEFKQQIQQRNSIEEFINLVEVLK